MKRAKIFLFTCFIVASCSTPVTPPVQTPVTSVAAKSNATSTLITPDPAAGNIIGNISWLDPVKLTKTPVKTVRIEINGHSGSSPKYTVKTDADGNYSFINIEPINYGFGIYFSIPISERLCDNPEFSYTLNLEWIHYTTALKGNLWFDIIFSSQDVLANAAETVVMDFVLKCP